MEFPAESPISQLKPTLNFFVRDRALYLIEEAGKCILKVVKCSEAALRSVLRKRYCFATLLKSHFGMGVFL